MKRLRVLPQTFGLIMLLGIASFALPSPVQAGGVHVSIGLGLPFPVVVAPPPPVVVAPYPVFVQPAPVIVAQPPVVVTRPRVVYGHPYYREHHALGTINTGSTGNITVITTMIRRPTAQSLRRENSSSKHTTPFPTAMLRKGVVFLCRPALGYFSSASLGGSVTYTS